MYTNLQKRQFFRTKKRASKQLLRNPFPSYSGILILSKTGNSFSVLSIIDQNKIRKCV